MVLHGEYVQMEISDEIVPDITLAIEPRDDYFRLVREWPHSHILEAVSGKFRTLIDTNEPQNISRHEHFCQIRLIRTSG